MSLRPLDRLPLHEANGRPAGAARGLLRVEELSAWYDRRQALSNIRLSVDPGQVTAIIGPSACGKSTLLRCLNRMHELVPGARLSGRVLLDGVDLYGPGIDPVWVRRRLGLLFPRPAIFPTLTILENVVVGLRLAGANGRLSMVERAEESLRTVGLWEALRDRLHQSPMSLSLGDQQRLCIARALSVEPTVLLLDEPTSLLDPGTTAALEELILRLKERYSVVLATHSPQQAARVSDQTAFILGGQLVEVGPTGRLFTNPTDPRTELYLTGRYG